MTPMHLKRTATFAVVGAALAAWLFAAATSGTRPAPEPPVRRTPANADVTVLTKRVTRLHDRLAPAATPIQPSRDLFRFAVPKPKPAPPSARAALIEAPAGSAVPVAPPRPALKLDGIAEDAQPGGVVRTAIIATGGQVFLAREGDAVTTRFKVSRIAADVVELVDLTDNSVIRLALK